MSKTLWVTSAVVAAAKLKVKRAEARGLPVDPATRAIANARRAPRPREETDPAQGRTG